MKKRTVIVAVIAFFSLALAAISFRIFDKETIEAEIRAILPIGDGKKLDQRVLNLEADQPWETIALELPKLEVSIEESSDYQLHIWSAKDQAAWSQWLDVKEEGPKTVRLGIKEGFKGEAPRLHLELKGPNFKQTTFKAESAALTLMSDLALKDLALDAGFLEVDLESSKAYPIRLEASLLEATLSFDHLDADLEVDSNLANLELNGEEINKGSYQRTIGQGGPAIKVDADSVELQLTWYN